MNSKETEKIEKYQDLVRGRQKRWNMKIEVIPVAMSTLRKSPRKSEKANWEN